MTVRYRHRDTGQTANYAQPIPQLERNDGWERVEDDARPAVSDPKADWVAYADSIGVDVEGLTKDEIIDAVS